MRNMSASLTTEQCVSFQKTVTRRNGWWNIARGEIVQLVEKGQGLKRGEHVRKLHKIQVLSARPEQLNILLKLPEYGRREMIAEGFPQMEPAEFVKMYCDKNSCTADVWVNRIAFRYYLTPLPDLTLAVPLTVAKCPLCGKQITIAPDGWVEDQNGMNVCDSYTSWCQEEPDMEDEQAYRAFEESHADMFNQPYVYLLQMYEVIDRWLSKTFRFELEEA